MTEEFLYYIWRYKLFNNELFTSSGEKISIFNQGIRNADSGPDFFNAKISIGNTLWAGNVEIHINSSDWYKHKHNLDKAYDSVILHVVYNNDVDVKRLDNQIIPVLELKGKFDENLYFRYEDFMNNKNIIPCEKLFYQADDFIVKSWLESLLIERLENKSKHIIKSLKFNNNDWEQTFYQNLAYNFGLKINSLTFKLLAESIPLKYLLKHKDNLLQIEAMLFGQSGLLDFNFNDEYPNILKREYIFLKNKFSLQPLEPHLWKYLRLRPSNFPNIRISQFANLIYKSSNLFSEIIENKNLNNIIALFNVSCSEYWDNHYVFDKLSVKRKKNLGKSFVNLILINSVIPFIFVYGIHKDIQEYKERALNFLMKIKGERNSIVKIWQSLGADITTAFNTQALIELKKNYCDKKKCLNCRIGNYLLRKNL